jgi:hypothetical protein
MIGKRGPTGQLRAAPGQGQSFDSYKLQSPSRKAVRKTVLYFSHLPFPELADTEEPLLIARTSQAES